MALKPKFRPLVEMFVANTLDGYDRVKTDEFIDILARKDGMGIKKAKALFADAVLDKKIKIVITRDHYVSITSCNGVRPNFFQSVYELIHGGGWFSLEKLREDTGLPNISFPRKVIEILDFLGMVDKKRVEPGVTVWAFIQGDFGSGDE